MAAPLGPTWEPPGPPKWPCHVIDPWELLQSQSQAFIQGGLINGQDLFIVDPWSHCHRLGSLHRLTNRHTCRISPCADFTTDLEEQPAPLDAKAVHPRAARCPTAVAQHPKSSTDLATAYKYHMPLYTINRGYGARWRSAPFISKISKLLLAF